MADVLTATTLATRALTHMQTICPEDTPAGDWTVAVDHRDGTAIVVWRTGSDGPMQSGVRGTRLYHWLTSLRDAGFVAQARTDMEAFGRPGEESPDGYARWLHITAWTEPPPKPAAPAPAAPPVQVTVQLPAGHGIRHALTGAVPESVTFTYRPGRTEVVLDWPDWSELEPAPEPWLLVLAAEVSPS